MNEIFTPQTGDEKMDAAYQKMYIHVAGYEFFEQFETYFNKIVTTDDKNKLNRWLLKVLFVDMKYKPKEETKSEIESKFSKLLSLTDQATKNNLNKWLDEQLKKYEE